MCFLRREAKAMPTPASTPSQINPFRTPRQIRSVRRPPQEDHPSREPGLGANAGLLPQTDRDAIRTLLQVRVSLADSLGPGQTGHSCLGVQGVAGSTVI